MSNVATTQEKKVTKIEVEDHPSFDANIKSCFINTIELAEVLDGLFGPAMRDYVGCKIALNDGKFQHITNEVPVGRLYVSLYFKDCSNTAGDCPIANVTPRANTKGASKIDSLFRMTGANAGRTYDVTEETYEALDSFRFFSNIRKANWNMLTTEVASNFGYAGTYNQEIVVCITGLDLEKIINVIYGNRTEEGIFQYQAVPVQIVANTSGEHVVQITQLDMNKLEDLRKSLGGPISRVEFHPYVRK